MAKTAIITGAGRGIGRACAATLLQQGWNVVLAGRQQGSLEAVIGDSKSGTGKVQLCDVRLYDEVENLFVSTIETFGHLDFVFNNAGIMGPAGEIDEIDLDAWRDTLGTNIEGMFNVARCAFSTMKNQKPQGGRILNNGSIAAHTPRPCTVPYTVTKHAVTGLTKCLSLDGRAYNIVCGQIDIGNVLTDMTVPMTQGMLQADGSRRPEPTFDLKHVADTVANIAGLPLEANVQFMTLMASGMPFIGRG